MKRFAAPLLAGALAVVASLGAARPASATDIWGGAYAHGVGTKQSHEGGADLMLGFETERVHALKWIFSPAIHGMVSFNTSVPTDFVALGFDWPIAILHSEHFYIRPGIGFAGTSAATTCSSPSWPSATGSTGTGRWRPATSTSPTARSCTRARTRAWTTSACA